MLKNALHIAFASTLPLALFAAGCGGSHVGSSAGNARANVLITTTSVVPANGQCAHITATRLADFQVSEYKGPLAGAVLQALVGDTRVTATAYGQPCAAEPASPPWLANAQIATFSVGANTLTLTFHENVNVTVNPVFNSDPAPLAVRPGTLKRTGRNGEDAAGPNLSLDGWEVKQFAVPPATGAETVLFTTEGKGVPYSPRGMAHLPDGTFIFQLSEANASLYGFSATGDPLGVWPVSYGAGFVQWDNTDGIEAIDATRLVRTGFINTPVDCDANNNGCVYSGLDILTRQTAGDGTISYAVTSQIKLPALAGEPLSQEYAVGVTPVSGNRFAVTTLPDGGGTRLTILNSDGTLAAGPTTIAGDVEGLFADGTRIVAVDYSGLVTTYDETTAALRSGESGSLVEGINLSTPFNIVWRNSSSNFVVATQDGHLAYVTPDFGAFTPVGIDLSRYSALSGVAYRPDTDQLLLQNRQAPLDSVSSTRIPVVDSYDLTSNTLVGSVKLQTGLALPLHPQSLSYIGKTQQLVTHFRRNTVDPSVDAVAVVLNLDGSLAYSFDLSPLGFRAIQSLSYDAVSDQLLFIVSDTAGTTRVVSTDRSGNPQRSYTVESVPYINGLAPIGSGPTMGDIGVVESQPSFFARVALP